MALLIPVNNQHASANKSLFQQRAWWPNPTVFMLWMKMVSPPPPAIFCWDTFTCPLCQMVWDLQLQFLPTIRMLVSIRVLLALPLGSGNRHFTRSCRLFCSWVKVGSKNSRASILLKLSRAVLLLLWDFFLFVSRWLGCAICSLLPVHVFLGLLWGCMRLAQHVIAMDLCIDNFPSFVCQRWCRLLPSLLFRVLDAGHPWGLAEIHYPGSKLPLVCL